MTRPVRPERTAWTYYVTRNSLDGALSTRCDLWYVKPTRCRHHSRVTWVSDPGHLGEFSLEKVHSWFRTTPDSDLQLIKVEQWAV